MLARGRGEGFPLVGAVAAERQADERDVVARGVLDQVAHAAHVGSRVAIRHELDARGFGEQQRRGARAVALHEEAAAEQMRIVG